jgi:hypothetical protein
LRPITAAIVSVTVVQAMQAGALTAILLLRNPAAARRAAQLAQLAGLGLCGTCASAGRCIALALSPAAPVRELGIIEALVAALADNGCL